MKQTSIVGIAQFLFAAIVSVVQGWQSSFNCLDAVLAEEQSKG